MHVVTSLAGIALFSAGASAAGDSQCSDKFRFVVDSL